MGEPAEGATSRLLTPSKITAWLDCPHYLTLKHDAEGGGPARANYTVGSFARLLQDKGLEHEAAVEAAYVDAGAGVHRVDAKQPGETFAEWADRVAGALGTDADVLFQMPLVHDGVRGVADFLEREIDPVSGRVRWEPVDAKLSRRSAKPGHVLQLCFYAEALEAATGEAPHRLQVSLGSGISEAVEFEEVRPYWDRLRGQLAAVMSSGPDGETRPEPCDHCGFCEFQPACEQVWRDEDSLVYVAGIRNNDRLALEAAGVPTLAALADRTESVGDLRDERLERLQIQAQLQVQARDAPEEAPPIRLIPAGEHPEWGHGFERLPAADNGDIFLDFEGHPFWRPDRGLFFLFGYIARDEGGTWQYHQAWAHDEAEERDRVRELVHFIRDRRAAHPGMHVYHYNHTERSALEVLAAEHGAAERTLTSLVEAGVFFDLLLVVRNAVQVGVESYSLKNIEVLTGYERTHEIDKGAGAVIAYDQYTHDQNEEHLAAIAAYNEDDVRATRALRDWLIEQRPSGIKWRVDPEVEPEGDDEIDELVEALASHTVGSPEHLMSGLLGYWRREWRAYIAPLIGLLGGGHGDLLANDGVLAGLADPQQFSRSTPTGRPAKWPGLRLSFPPQELGRAFAEDSPPSLIYATPDGLLGFVDVDRLDIANGEIDLVWSGRAQELGEVPCAVVPNEWVSPSSKWTALLDLARQVLDPKTHGPPSPVTMALLEAASPEFTDPPDDRGLSDDVDELADIACRLRSSVLGVQGPPGTGKTFRGAHMAKALVAADKRVGIMAMSHHAIDNFLEEIVDVFAATPSEELRAIRKREKPADGGLPRVTYTTANSALARDEFNVVAATSWQFAGRDLRAAPVDVLLIDEAGQLALIDAVVASMAAENVVLLGDPLQLPQVAQATHPGDSGASALGHLLGNEITISPDRGVFIKETRRMHPDLCRFISERIYRGRLTSHVDCARQSTEHGTGLRWIRAEHSDCSTESDVEATIVADHVRSSLGINWVDKTGTTRTIGPGDVMVVAPYNDQVRLLRSYFDADPATRSVQVGTVDKFQGRQAPIVFFTMTSSSADDMPRGAEFLFSRNRLNVAITRAECLAYLVCTEDLLSSRARTVEDMILISTLCSFAEYADVVR